MQHLLFLIVLMLSVFNNLSANKNLKQKTDNGNYIKVVKPDFNDYGNFFKMGTSINPEGDTLGVNSFGILLNGVPMIPVMGEFHYSRYPDTEWRKELLKMKAGGINIIASYIFWIHHEEIEGEYNWKGQCNLRKFIEICHELNLYFVLRIGPWCHGEARNGGFPEWMVNSGIKLRNDNEAYLQKVNMWFQQLFNQVQGLMWKDGGPVIAIQIENEYRGRGEHLLTLKKMIRQIGFDVPIYTRTGWPKLATPVPFGEILPLYGDYADGFWDRSLAGMPGDYGKSFIFRSFRNSTVIATEQLPRQSDQDNPDDIGYPYFTCELGGGMMTSYHRRVNIDPMDVFAMSLVRVGSGSNLPGYYMYHGGTNPTGKLTTLNESQVSNYTSHNDLPVKTYDFQAPLGEFGQINPHYHLLRPLHLFLQDFGHELALMPPSFPQDMPDGFNDDSVLRWCVRSNGKSGYVFVNNYHRMKKLTAKKGIRFTIDLPEGEIIFPSKPVTVPSGGSFWMPFNMKLGQSNLIYSTAQPIAKLRQDNNTVVVFSQIRDIPSEFVFENHNISVESSNVTPRRRNNRIYFDNTKTGTKAAIVLKQPDHSTITIILLDENHTLAFWKGKLVGKERFFISTCGLTFQDDQLQLEDEIKKNFTVSIYPAPSSLLFHEKPVPGKTDGLFTRYDISVPAQKPITAKLFPIQDALLPLRKINIGKSKVAEQPSDEDFKKAASWKIALSEPIAGRDIYLRFPYTGDVARIYSGNKLLTDNFYNGKVFEIGLKRLDSLAEHRLKIEILPLQKNVPIYYPESLLPDFNNSDYTIGLPKIDVIEKYNVTLRIVE